MGSDNPTGADNQQERPGSSGWMDRIHCDLGNWVAGFVDGEGSFNVPIRREYDRGMPWRIGLSFNVSQVGDAAPQLLHSVFGCGTVRGRRDGVFYYEVTTPAQLEEVVFPFFDCFPCHLDNSPACPSTRQTLVGLTATMSASSIMNVSRR